MTHSIRKAAVVLGCAAAALGLGMASASAATTFSVKAGTAAAGTTVAITGTTTGSSPQINFVDTTTGTALACNSGTAAGSTKTGTGLAGAKLGTINGATSKFNSCSGPLGLNLVVTGSGTWTINGVSGNANAVNGTIGAVKATVKDTGGNCSFSVAGSVKAQIVNSNSTLVLPGTTSTLKISNVVGCFGVVNTGDVASFKATYALKATTAAFNPVKVTAP